MEAVSNSYNFKIERYKKLMVIPASLINIIFTIENGLDFNNPSRFNENQVCKNSIFYSIRHLPFVH
jgi:hypothetical protein